MLGKKDYEEKLFLSFSLSKKEPENNFYRQLKKFLTFSLSGIWRVRIMGGRA